MIVPPKRSLFALARHWSGVPAICAVAVASHAANVVPRMMLLDGAVVGDAVIAVGERGTILSSPTGGRTWERRASEVNATLTGVSFADDGRHGWAVGHDALILGSDDGGRTWRPQFQGGNLEDSFLDVLALDTRRVIAVGAYGLFVATSDGGKTWTRRSILPDDHHLNRISRGPSGTLYLAGEHGTLLRSTDGGQRWTPIPAPYTGSFYGILPLDARTLVAHGLRGHVFRSSDDGASWEPVQIATPVLLATAVPLADGSILLAGHARTLLGSSDRGASFAPLPSPPASAVAELIALRDGGVIALGEAGALVLPAAAIRRHP